MKLKKFIIAGVIAAGSLVGTFLGFDSSENRQQFVNDIQKNEQMTNVNITVENSFDSASSYAKFSRSKTYSNEAKIEISPYNIIPATFAPIEFIKTDTNLWNKLMILHELAHTELNYDFYNQNPYQNVNIQIDGASDKMNRLFNNIVLTEEFDRSKPRTLFSSAYHEHFADSYGSILVIRNLQKEFTDDEIRQSIQTRYNQSKNQENVLWGAGGSIEHRTKFSLEKVLNLDFEKVRELSPVEAKQLAIKIASNGLVEQFPTKFKNTALHYKDQLPDDNIEVMQALKTDNSFLSAYQLSEPGSAPPVNQYAHLKNIDLNDKVSKFQQNQQDQELQNTVKQSVKPS